MEEERARRNVAGRESSLVLDLEETAQAMSGGGERAKGAVDLPGRGVANGGSYVRLCRFCLGLIAPVIWIMNAGHIYSLESSSLPRSFYMSHLTIPLGTSTIFTHMISLFDFGSAVCITGF